MKKYILSHNNKGIALGGRKDLPLLRDIALTGGPDWRVTRQARQKNNFDRDTDGKNNLNFPLDNK